MTNQPPHGGEPMIGDLQDYVAALEEIDAKIHRLLENHSAGEEMDATLQADTIQIKLGTLQDLTVLAHPDYPAAGRGFCKWGWNTQ